MSAAAGLRLVGAAPKPSFVDATRKWADGWKLVAAAAVELHEAVAAMQAPPETADAPERWIVPVEAARIAGLDVKTEDAQRVAARRILGWARGKRWASHPNQRTVLIEESGFRDWLKSRRGGK